MQFKKAKSIVSILVVCMLIQQLVLAREIQASSDSRVPRKLAITDSCKNFITLIIAKAERHNKLESLSESLYRCYERIVSGKSTLITDDVIGAYPELVQELQGLIQLSKAPRPGGNVNPPVGPIIECNVQDVTKFVEIVSTIINNCCAELQQDFEFTWTFLAEIQNAINSSSTLISVESTLTTCCANITNNFISTWSILADIDQTLIFDFNGVFTMLEDIRDSLGSVTVSVDFSPVFTVLADIDTTLTVNFDGTFTVLQDIKNTLTECLCGVLDGTFTVLADIKNTLTVDFNGTFTILEQIVNNSSSTSFTGLEALKTTITLNFDGTFTVLQDIKNTLTECCANLQQDFEDTWTILADIQETITDNFDGTFTALAGLVFSGSVIADFNSVYTVLNAGFDGTFTVIAEIKNTVTSISLDGTFTILEEMSACFATSLTAGTNITSAGYYCLANDVTGSFTLTANDVVLDLNNYTVSNGGIFILTGTNRTVKGGRLNSSANGIVMTTNYNTLLENLSITNPTTIAITGTSGSIDNTIRNVLIENGTGGIACVNDTNLTIEDVTINGMTSFGMSFTANNNLNINGATISNTGSDGIDMDNPVNASLRNISIYRASVAGIITSGSALRCIFEDIEVTNSSMTYGININLASFCAVRRCSVSHLTASPATNGIIGIFLGPFLSSGGNNTVEFCSVQNINAGIEPTNTTGIHINGANTVINGCVVQGIIINSNAASQQLATHSCYRINGTDNYCSNCVAANIQNLGVLNSGRAVGFSMNGSNVQTNNCIVSGVSVTTANPALGFALSAANNTCVNCAVNNIHYPGGGTVGGWGFICESTAALLVNCSVFDSQSGGFNVNAFATAINCQAARCAGNGFNTTAGSGISIADCTAISNVNGFVLPGGNTNAVYHCFAADNSSNNFLNMPNAQLPTATVIAGSNVRFTSP